MSYIMWSPNLKSLTYYQPYIIYVLKPDPVNSLGEVKKNNNAYKYLLDLSYIDRIIHRIVIIELN